MGASSTAGETLETGAGGLGREVKEESFGFFLNQSTAVHLYREKGCVTSIDLDINTKDLQAEYNLLSLRKICDSAKLRKELHPPSSAEGKE